jgi:cadmium resistance protein CadD (predicted permease)
LVLIALSCAWLVGILVGWYFDVSWYYGLLGLLPLALLFLTRRYRKAFLL